MNNILSSTKPGDAIRVNNTVYVKQADGRWRSPFGVTLESTLAYDLAGKKVEFITSKQEKRENSAKIEEIPVKNDAKSEDFPRRYEEKYRKKRNKEKEIELNETKGDNEVIEFNKED